MLFGTGCRDVLWAPALGAGATARNAADGEVAHSQCLCTVCACVRSPCPRGPWGAFGVFGELCVMWDRQIFWPLGAGGECCRIPRDKPAPPASSALPRVLISLSERWARREQIRGVYILLIHPDQTGFLLARCFAEGMRKLLICQFWLLTGCGRLGGCWHTPLGPLGLWPSELMSSSLALGHELFLLVLCSLSL